MTKPTLIIYQAGACGTFLEWLLTYLTDKTLDDQLPFARAGNAHKFLGHFFGYEQFKKTTTHSTFNFARCHAEDITLEQINSLFSSTIEITIPPTSVLWVLRNCIAKTEMSELLGVEELREYVKFRHSDLIKLHKKYDGDQRDYRWAYQLMGHFEHEQLDPYNVNNVEDLKRWQLREILSYWNLHDYLVNIPSFTHTSNYPISIEDIRDQMPTVINDLIEKLKLKVIPNRYEKLEYIYQQWKSKQKYTNIDAVVDQYIKNVIDDIDETVTTPFNIGEEAIIQQKLREVGYEIKCDGLDGLPLRTIDLKGLLYNV